MSSILDSIKKSVLQEKSSEQDFNADKVDFDMAAQLESKKKRARKAKDEDEDTKSERRSRKAKDEDSDELKEDQECEDENIVGTSNTKMQDGLNSVKMRKAKDEDEDDDLESRRSRKAKAEDDEDDMKSERRGRKAKDEDEDDDMKSSRRSRKAKAEDDEDKLEEGEFKGVTIDDDGVAKRRARKAKDEDDDSDEDKFRKRLRKAKDEDEDDLESRRSRKAKDEDEDDDKPFRKSRKAKAEDDEDDEDDMKSSRRSRKAKDEDSDEMDEEVSASDRKQGEVDIDDSGIAKRKAKDEDKDDLDSDTIKIEKKKIRKEDIDLDNHMKALFGSDKTLTEDFKSKAQTIFEAAVITAANKAVADVQAELVREHTQEIKSFKKSYDKVMVEKVDGYLEKIVSEWKEENKPAIHRNIKTELAESFLSGLKILFAEHYVELPDNKVDLVRQLVEKAEDLTVRLNKEMSKNVELKETVKDLRAEQIILENAEGLSENEKDKLRTLAEGIEYTTSKEYAAKVLEIKESYFAETTYIGSVEADEEQLTIDEEVKTASNPEMSAFVSSISRHLGSKPKKKA